MPRSPSSRSGASTSRARKVEGERITLAVVELAPGSTIPEHRHVAEQVGICVSGQLTFTIGDETRTLGPGGTWCVPSGVAHHIEAGPGGAVGHRHLLAHPRRSGTSRSWRPSRRPGPPPTDRGRREGTRTRRARARSGALAEGARGASRAADYLSSSLASRREVMVSADEAQRRQVGHVEEDHRLDDPVVSPRMQVHAAVEGRDLHERAQRLGIGRDGEERGAEQEQRQGDDEDQVEVLPLAHEGRGRRAQPAAAASR